MSISPNQVANDALEVLEKLAVDESVLTEIDALCKQAGVENDDASFVEKFARSFEQASGLSTEDLVKRALRRFKKDQDTDLILKGIKSATDEDRVKCAAVCGMLSEQDLRNDPEDAALVAVLEKQAIGGALRGIGSAAMGMGRKLFNPALIGAGAGVAGTMGGQKGWEHAKEKWGPQAGRREYMQKFGPMMAQGFSRGGNPQAIVEMMRGMGDNYDPQMLDMLERALSFRRNPWVPSYWS